MKERMEIKEILTKELKHITNNKQPTNKNIIL